MSNDKCPLVSVIVCAYNGEELVRSCLSGLISQKCPTDRYEVLIIDDGSTDSTFAIVSDFINSQKNNSLHIRLIQIRHGGLSVARNTGIHLSRGDIITFIDQDAVADENWVAELLKAWEEVPDADVIGGRVMIRNVANRTAQFLFCVYYEPIEPHAIIGTNMSFSKDRLLRIGAFGDPFTSRGDETFLLQKMGTERKELKWRDAIVFHDCPVSIGQWMKERLSNGKMSRLISRILDDRQSMCGAFVRNRLVEGSVVMVLFSFKVLLGLLLLLGILWARGVRHGVYRILRKNHSLGLALLLTLFWQLLKDAGDWMFCLGRWRGAEIPFEKNRAMKGTVSDKNIIKEVANW